MRNTDYPAPPRIVDEEGVDYRLRFQSRRSGNRAPGQLVAIPIGADQAPPITLTRDDVTLADLDAELSRWTEWPVRIASSPGGHMPEITLNEPPRRLVGAGLQHPPADT